MRTISRKRLADFWELHPDSKMPLEGWFKAVLNADWASLIDVRKNFPHADGIELKCGLVITVFNAGGNKFRIITRIIYPYRRIYVKAVLTHKQYDSNQWKAQLCREYMNE